MSPTSRPVILDILYSVFSNTKLVKEAFDKVLLCDFLSSLSKPLKNVSNFTNCLIFFFSQGAVIYILDVFCNSEVPANREKSAEVLSKMVTDKLVGPKVRICVTRFLPSIFLDAMKQSPEAAVRYYTYILHPFSQSNVNT